MCIRDRCRGGATEAIEEGDHLGHGGHLHLLRGASQDVQRAQKQLDFALDNGLTGRCEDQKARERQGREVSVEFVQTGYSPLTIRSLALDCAEPH